MSKNALTKEVKIPKIFSTSLLIALLVASVVGAISYRYGESRGRDSGYKTGYKTGYDEAPKRGFMDDFYKDETERLTTEYNQLVNDYNDLRNKAIQYVNSTQYQARQPITCNTYNYSMLNSSTTTCY